MFSAVFAVFKALVFIVCRLLYRSLLNRRHCRLWCNRRNIWLRRIRVSVIIVTAQVIVSWLICIILIRLRLRRGISVYCRLWIFHIILRLRRGLILR